MRKYGLAIEKLGIEFSSKEECLSTLSKILDGKLSRIGYNGTRTGLPEGELYISVYVFNEKGDCDATTETKQVGQLENQDF